MVSGGTKDFVTISLYTTYILFTFAIFIFIQPKFYWKTRFFFILFFEVRKFVKSWRAKFPTLQRVCGYNFYFWGEIFTPEILFSIFLRKQKSLSKTTALLTYMKVKLPARDLEKFQKEKGILSKRFLHITLLKIETNDVFSVLYFNPVKN